MFKLVTRRQAMALGAISAVSLFSRPVRADLAPLIEAARKEGSLTWYIAQIDGETAELVGKSFTALFPGVTVTVMRTTGQVAYERLLNDLKNSVPNCDVFSSTDISHYPALMAKKALAKPAGVVLRMAARSGDGGRRCIRLPSVTGTLAHVGGLKSPQSRVRLV